MNPLVVEIKTVHEAAGAEAWIRSTEQSIGKAKAAGKEYAEQEERVKAVKKALDDFNAEQERNAQAAMARAKAEADAQAAITKAVQEKAAAETKAAAEAKAASDAKSAAEAKALADMKAAAAARIELSKKISADFQNKNNEATRQQVQSSFDKKTADAKAATDAELAAKTKAAADAKAAAAQAAKAASAQSAKELAEQNKQVGEFQQKLAEVVPAFSRVQSVIGGLISGPVALLTIGLGAVGTAIGVAKKGLEEFAESSQHIARLDAALARTGQLSEATRESFISLADSMPKGIGVDTNQWLDVLTRLTQFGANAGSIEKSAEAVKNFAGITGDLNSAVMGVAKAMQGNFEVFRRWGIYIDTHASQTKKLSQLYSELAQRGGGQLEAMNKTLGGQWVAMKYQLGDLVKTFGQGISDGYNFSGALKRVNETLQDLNTVTQHAPPILEGLNNAQSSLVESANEAALAEANQASAIDQTAEAAKRASAALEELLADQDRRRQQADEEANARMALDLEIVDQNEKRGTISKADAIAARYQIRKKYADEAHKAEIASLKERIEMEQNYIDTLDQELHRRYALAQMYSVRAQVSDKMAALPRMIQDSIKTETKAKEDLRALDDTMPGQIAVWQPGTKERARLEKEYADRRKALQDTISSSQSSTASNRKTLRELRAEFPNMATPAEEKEISKKLDREALQFDRENTEPANRARHDIRTSEDRISSLNRVYSLRSEKEKISAQGDYVQANAEQMKERFPDEYSRANDALLRSVNQFSTAYQNTSARMIQAFDNQTQYTKQIDARMNQMEQRINNTENWVKNSGRY